MNRYANSHLHSDSRTGNNGRNDIHTRPTHRPAQTLKQARAEYKKHGPRLSSQESRQLARGAELLARAERIRENERKRKASAKKKQEKETREREARRRMGIASQEKVHVSPRQKRVGDFLKLEKIGGKVGEHDLAFQEGGEMECDERIMREDQCEGGLQEVELGNKDEVAEDPWELEELDEASLLDTMESVRTTSYATLSEKEPRLPPDTRQCLSIEPPSGSTGDQNQPQTSIQLLNTDDIWDDLVVSATQVQREISSEPSPEAQRPYETKSSPRSPPLSTQDVSFSNDDLVELGLDICDSPVENITPPPRVSSQSTPPAGKRVQPCPDRDRQLMPPPIIPASKLVKPTTPRVPLKPLRPSLPTTLPLDLLEADFELSSQDRREIDYG